jgi:hypothetical protein
VSRQSGEPAGDGAEHDVGVDRGRDVDGDFTPAGRAMRAEPGEVGHLEAREPVEPERLAASERAVALLELGDKGLARHVERGPRAQPAARERVADVCGGAVGFGDLDEQQVAVARGDPHALVVQRHDVTR